MPGLSDYSSKAFNNWVAGAAAVPALASRYLALFTTAPADDGTGGTEVSGGSYARVQVAGAATTNSTTASGNATLHFASTPAWIVAGMYIYDITAPTVIPANTKVLSVTGTTVVMDTNATGAGVGNGDSIVFSAFAPATAASGAEPATTPGNITSSSIITFPQATADWGTVVAFGLYDASTSGNLIEFDFMGNYAWLPFTCTSASPGVLTSPAHGYSNGDSVVVTAKFGGTLPATGGSWSGLKTVASAATDTFTAGVNTTGTGDGSVRKVASQSIPNNITASFAASALVLTAA